MKKIPQVYSHLLARLEYALLRHPRTVLLLICLACGFSLFYTVGHLGIDTDTTKILSQDLPFQQHRKRLMEAFPQDDQSILVVVDANTPEHTEQALDYLEARFNHEKQQIQAVYIPGAGEFFDRHSLLYLDLDQLNALAAKLTEAQPFIGTLSKDNSLKGLLSIIGQAISTQERKLPTELNPLLDKIRLAIRAVLDDNAYQLSWQQMLFEKEDQAVLSRQRFILLQPILDFDELRPAEKSLTAVQAIVQKAKQDLPGVNIRLTGEVVLEHDELTTVTYSAEIASIFSLILVCLTLIIGYRSVKMMLITLTVIVMGLILTAGFAALTVGHLNVISIAFATLYIGIGDDYTVQLCLRYRELLARKLSRQQALIGAVHKVSPSITLCAITGATGFFAFVPTAYTGVSELGIISGVGIFISLLITLTALPALLVLFPLKAATTKPDSFFPGWVYRFPMRHATLIRWATGALIITGLAVLTQVRFDVNPLNLRNPKTESVATFRELLKTKHASPMTLSVLTETKDQALAKARKLKQLESVENAITIFDYIPDAQQAKLAVLEDLSLIMGLQLTTFPPVRKDNTEDHIAALKKLEQSIDQHLTRQPNSRLSETLRPLREDLERLIASLQTASAAQKTAKLGKLQSSLLDTLPDTMNTLLKGLGAGPVTIDDLPSDLTKRWLSKDGIYRIMVTPSKDLNDQKNLKDFVNEVRELAPDATDLPVIYLESGNAIVKAFQQALVSALAAIIVVLLLSRRHIKDIPLILLPLLMTGILTAASTVVMDNPFNFANIIVIPLLFGLGIDAGIYIMDRLHNPGREDSVLQTSTARGVVFGEMTTLCSLVSMAFTPHPGLASLGQLLAIGLILMVLCTLIVLPAFAYKIAD